MDFNFFPFCITPSSVVITFVQVFSSLLQALHAMQHNNVVAMKAFNLLMRIISFLFSRDKVSANERNDKPKNESFSGFCCFHFSFI